jgi:uncharacterized protein
MPSSMNRRNLISGFAAAALLGPALARAHGRRDRRNELREHFETTRTELFVRGLDPAHDGLTIAQLSDIHVGRGTPNGRIFAAVRALNDAKPDLAILTGDYVTWRSDPIEAISVALLGIEAPTFAVMGNHDHYTETPRVRTELESLGYTVLQNEHTLTRVRGAPLAILGVDDSHTGNDDVDATFKGAPKSGSRIVLAHTPTGANKLPAWQDLVCFSGHTHGGQFVVPRLTEGIFKRAGQPYIRGLYSVRGNQLYVNRGLGFGRGSFPPRLGSEPELALITLRVAV